MPPTIEIKAPAEAATGPKNYRLLIDGQWVAAKDGKTIERVSPAHGFVVSQYAGGGPPDVDLAVAAARRAFEGGPWPKMTASERAAILLRAADAIENRVEEIARLDVLEAGKPIAQARGEITGAIDIWRYAAALARTLSGDSYASLGANMLGVVLREPVGVVGLITPWNFPFLIISQKLPFALAAGCTAVVKPSEMTSASTLVLGQILLDAGLPPGVVNIVTGDGTEVGAPMVEHVEVDMVSFTGSTRVGKITMAAAAGGVKKVALELGGKNAQIIFPDADLDAAVDAVVFGGFFNAGECCNAGSRLIIHRDIAETFLCRVQAHAKMVVVGDPLDEKTKIGALISADHHEKISTHLADAHSDGAEVLGGGGTAPSSAGQFFNPTIVTDVTAQMAIAREEVFGPVLSVLSFEAPQEAVRLANATDFGLSAGVWSADMDTCFGVLRGVRAGTVWVNTFMDGTPELPFGGYKQSGLGRELGKDAVKEFTEEKTVQFHRGARTGWWIK
jgi:acyl-CoA reductase-like NAD-dependent aldehyde dehydrogenase